jgi:hypothetical protein
VIVDHLGDAYRKAGNLERARAMYERALGEVKQLDTPDPQLQRSIEEKLQAIPKGGK